jgi:hypothetical protein
MRVICSEKVARLVGRVIPVQALGFDGYCKVMGLSEAHGSFYAFIVPVDGVLLRIGRPA